MSIFPRLLPVEIMAFHYIAWGELLDDLNEAEYNQASIARLLNLPVTTVKSWRKNSEQEPRFCNGLSLLQLHAKIFGEQTTINRITAMHERAKRATVTTG